MDKDLIGKKSVFLTKDVITLELDPVVTDIMAAIHDFGFRQMWERSADMVGLLDLTKNVSRAFENTCECNITLGIIKKHLWFRFVKKRYTIRKTTKYRF